MSDTIRIIVNILGFIGMGLFFISSFLKNKKGVLTLQSGGHIFLAVTEYLSGTHSTIIQEAICWIRDIGIITNKANKYFKIIIIILIVAVGVTLNIVFDRNKPSFWFGFLVIFANLIWTIDVFYNSKSIIAFKYVSSFSNFCWMALFISSEVYSSAIWNGLSGIINLIVGTIIFIQFRKNKVDRLGNRTKTSENE